MTLASRRRFLPLLLAISLVAASCGLSRGGSSTAATITFPDGTEVEISRDDLDEIYDSLIADDEFVEAAFGNETDGLRASILTDLVVDRIIDDAIDENGVTVGDDDLDSGRETILALVAQVFPTATDPVEQAETTYAGNRYLQFLGDRQGKQLALGDVLLGDADLGETVEVPCSSHILLETEADALDVLAELDGGADFATLAMERSTGPSGPSGGVLGCTDPNQFVEPFRDAIVGAPVGTFIGPVETQFGFHVITVTAVEEQAIDAPDAQSLVASTIRSTLSQILVDVDPQIGEWDGARAAVVPA